MTSVTSLQIYKMTTELQSAFETEVLDFLNSCQEGTEVLHTHATRRNLGRLANSVSVEDVSGSVNSVAAGTRRQMRLRSAHDHLSEDGSTSVSVDISTPTTPVSEISCTRETRSMTLVLKTTQSESDHFSMTLRSRESRRRILDDSASEEEEDEDEESNTPLQRSRRRRTDRMPRKRQRMASSDSESDSVDSIDFPMVHTITRKGRVVKPTSKLALN